MMMCIIDYVCLCGIVWMVGEVLCENMVMILFVKLCGFVVLMMEELGVVGFRMKL